MDYIIHIFHKRHGQLGIEVARPRARTRTKQNEQSFICRCDSAEFIGQGLLYYKLAGSDLISFDVSYAYCVYPGSMNRIQP
jgi:hypothetical protein